MVQQSGFRVFVGSTLGRWVITAVLAVVVWGLLFLFLALQIPAISFILMIPCVYFGWKTLNKITPDIFVFMPIGGWIIYFVIKFLLSIIVGAFATPIYLGKKLSFAVQDVIVEAMDEASKQTKL